MVDKLAHQIPLGTDRETVVLTLGAGTLNLLEKLWKVGFFSFQDSSTH